MNSTLLYQWSETIDKAFPGMGRWQKQMLARFSYGVLLARGSQDGRRPAAWNGACSAG
jgi:hypothetical protein